MDFKNALTQEEQSFLEQYTENFKDMPFLSGYKTGRFTSVSLDVSAELLPNQYYVNVDLPIHDVSGNNIGLPSRFKTTISNLGFMRYDIIRSDVQDDLGKLIFDTYSDVLFFIRTGHSQEVYDKLKDESLELRNNPLETKYHFSDIMYIREAFSVLLFADLIQKDFKTCSSCLFEENNKHFFNSLINEALYCTLSKKGYNFSDFLYRCKEPPFVESTSMNARYD